MKTILTAAVVMIAVQPAFAQPAVTTPAAQQIVYRTQMIRDRIGVLCQRLPVVHKRDLPTRDECETSAFTSYYGIVDTIRKAEHNPGDEALKIIDQKIAEFETTVAPLIQSLER